MKNTLTFFLIISCYLLTISLSNNLLQIESKIFDFLAKSYPNSVVQNYMESQKKWWWLSYIVTPLLIGLKVILVAFCLNFVKLLDIPALEKVRFSEFIFWALIADSVFIIAGFYKFVNFYWINTGYSLEDLQTYFPISLLNLKEHISTEKWLAYPLQLINLFELAYWIILAVGIRELSNETISYAKSFGLVALTYGVGLLFWVGIVSFVILNASY